MGAGILIRDTVFWTTPGTGINITWANQATYDEVTDANGDVTDTGEALSTAQVATVRTLLGAYSDVSNLTFTEVNPGGTSDEAVMLFAAYDSEADGAGAYANFPGSTSFDNEAGDVRLNNDSVSQTSIPQGSYSYWAIMHEIGHAMGLDHPGDYNAEEGVDIVYETSAQFTQDSLQYSIMSYFEADNTTADPGSYPDTLMLYDILAIQQAYGANMSTRAGNSIYGFGANTGATYDFTVNTRPALCIWDGGGTDTINASGFSANQKIDLRAGAFSDINGIAANVSIAFGAVIEKATGGSGNDTLIGNAVNNTLAGGAGSDTYYVQNTGDVLVEAKGKGTDTVFSTVSFVLKSGVYVENLTLTGSGDLNATGNGIANTLTGNAGVNVLTGGAGEDRMIGGKGDDTYYVDDKDDVVIEAKGSGTGTDRVYASSDYSIVGQYVEYLTLTGSADVYAKGNGIDNRLVGNTGDNRINGMGGQDRLTGGGGADTFIWDATSHSKVNDSDRIVDLSSNDVIDLSRIDANVNVGGTQHFTLVDAFTNTAGQVMLDYDASTKVTSLTADTNGDGVADMLVRITGDHDDRFRLYPIAREN
ncbi:MAG: matrixin family metalloprotease [Caulobacteraceae bacterium]|nr:MAG: matrixin family metalloprotease [Caulobacteraceae bacterium]